MYICNIYIIQSKMHKYICIYLQNVKCMHISTCILFTKTTAVQNEVVLSYHRVRGLYFRAVVFVLVVTIIVAMHCCTPGNSMVLNLLWFIVMHYIFYIIQDSYMEFGL